MGGTGSAGIVSKPYEDYRRPRAVSPYMQLGQVINSYGDIDPYNSIVRPELEQIQAAHQVGTQIRGLQRSVQVLGRQTQSLRGIVIPQYYMNDGNYYPALSR
jgi:hypothetical protein